MTFNSHHRNRLQGQISVIAPVLLLVILLVWFPHVALAEDILVPDDYDTIGEAMEDAESGDTVFVKEGTYNERITVKEGVNLVSDAGDDGNDLVDGPGNKKVQRRAARTIIDRSDIDEPGYLVSFPKDTTAIMRLDGSTMINMPKYVSGIKLFMIEIRGCSPEVVNNGQFPASRDTFLLNPVL